MAESSTILRDVVRPNQANKQLKFIIGGLVVLALIAYLIISAVQQAGSYYREVGEVLAQQTALTNKPLRVNGDIVPNSIVFDATTLDLNFAISDPTDAAKILPIHMKGVKPDQMDTPGSSAIVEGTLRPSGTVEASQLMLKCPSRYEQFDQITVKAAP